MTKKSFSSLKAGTKAKLSSAAALASTALATSPVFADGDPFESAKSAGNTFVEKLTDFAPVVFLICLVIIGLMFAFGDMGKRKSMGWLPWVVVAIAVVSGATSILNFIQGLFN